MKTGLFVFRKDLRLVDNLGLLYISKVCDNVIPLFILTDTQLVNNDYRSDKAVSFMYQCLDNLNSELNKIGHKLILRKGEPVDVIKEFNDIDCVCVNLDYTPYAVERDSKIEDYCIQNDIDFYGLHDDLIHPINSIKTGNNTIYKKFTAFYKKCLQYEIDVPDRTPITNFKSDYRSDEIDVNYDTVIKGGRSNCDITKLSIDYDGLESSRLSAYIKFGCISVREAAEYSTDDMLRSLFWRDFYYNIVYNYPEVIGSDFKENRIEWEVDTDYFELWKEGKTGIPIVDAAMRQLNEEGLIHNRLRLIVSNVLVKLLRVDWMKGEHYFATKLIDYDPAVNNGNWQWVAGTGTDSQPYFRIINPWLQSKKFDPNGEYIKRWIPELSTINSKELHVENGNRGSYILPCIDYKESRSITLEMVKK